MLCGRCKIDKDSTEFTKDKQRKSGYKFACRVCCAEMYALWAKKPENTERLKKRDADRDYAKKHAARDQWRRENREAYNKLQREERAKKSEQYQKYYRDYRNKHKTDIQWKLKETCRARVYKALKGLRVSSKLTDLLGCTVEELRCYLERKFKPGMTWDNWSYEGWHIDHIKPLASFDLTDPEQLKQACHYTNLQPLWAEENLSKSSRVS